MKQEHKKWIDNASYEQLLSKWRYAPMGDPFFMDDTGEYYAKVMKKRKSEIGDEEHAKISKNIEW